ncbi:MAG TPA: ATPase, partial [Microbacterium sp.]|nr:ATPase [Microbacterium sp.]
MADTVATYPRIVAVVETPTGGTVSIDGRTRPVAGPDEQGVRKEIHALVTATAMELHRPVRLTTRDARGEQQFAVHPDGRMEPLSLLDETAAVPPTVPAVDDEPVEAPRARAAAAAI